MSYEELRRQIDEGVVFWGYEESETLEAVMEAARKTPVEIAVFPNTWTLHRLRCGIAKPPQSGLIFETIYYGTVQSKAEFLASVKKSMSIRVDKKVKVS